MTSLDIRSFLCKWISSLGYKAIQFPTNTPAPSGLYIAVSSGMVSQYGAMTNPGPDDSGTKKRIVQNVISITLNEVEGDGDALRAIKNSLQSKEFRDYAKSELQGEDLNFDTGVSIWEIGDIVDISVKDGDFNIKQFTMKFDVNFNDIISSPVSKKILSVSGTIGNENFET